MEFQALKNQVIQWLDEGQPSKIIKNAILKKISSEPSPQARQLQHLLAQSYLQTGDLDSAKNILLHLEPTHGEYIGILSDLACLYYQTGEIHQWRLTTLQLQNRLEKIGHLISAESWIKTQILIGKFQEEEGRISEANECYHEAYLRSKKINHFKFIHHSLIQLLRIEALFQRGPELGAWYKELISIPNHQVDQELFIEREHTLMLTEIELIGEQHSWQRMKPLLNNPSISEPDQRLMIADYICEVLCRGNKVPIELYKYLDLLAEGDVFELELMRVLKQTDQGEDSDETFQRLNHLASETSWACYLRILTLHHQLTPNESFQNELANKLSILLGSLSPTSRYYWMKRVQTRVFNNDLKFEYDPTSRTISFQGKTLNISKRRTLCAVFEKLSQDRDLDVDSMIHHLWQSDFSPEHLHRLRMSVHRLNLMLFELSAIQRVIEMTSDRISLKKLIRVQFTE